MVGWYKSQRFSARAIDPFIRQYHILVEEFEARRYGSFNEFFIRKFQPGVRPFCPEPYHMPAFAEARYFAYREVGATHLVPVKGAELLPEAILGGSENAAPFLGGPALVARLAPVDYHRFHFPDDGAILKHYPLAGALHAVNPLALAYKRDLFATNERKVSLLDTEHFGRLAYVEVGALCVGRIVHTHAHEGRFQRGAEKGYFLFGASTVIVFGEPGAWVPAPDLLEQTALGRETLVRLGETVALAVGTIPAA